MVSAISSMGMNPGLGDEVSHRIGSGLEGATPQTSEN